MLFSLWGVSARESFAPVLEQSASILDTGQVIPLIVWGRKNRVLPFGDTEKRQVCYLVVTMGASKRVITLKHSMFFLEQELHLLKNYK
jgi:hypothetical protein